MIEILNICLHQNSIFNKFLKILKIHEFFCENPRIIFVLFYNIRKENMFTINLEDGREAPSKASILNIFNSYKDKKRKILFQEDLKKTYTMHKTFYIQAIFHYCCYQTINS